MEAVPGNMAPAWWEFPVYLWPALLYLGWALVLGILGKRRGRQLTWVAVAVSGAACGLAALAWAMGWPWFHEKFEWEWLELGQREIVLRVQFDKAAAVMQCVVTGITFLVHIFSAAYMKGEENLHRYWAFLSFFAAAMCGIVLAGDYLLMFVCWELVGLCSYFLIGFWFKREEAARASQKAFIVNRIGDLGFVVALLCMYATHGGFGITETEAAWGSAPQWAKLLGGLGLALAAFGKSAQFPLQVWLPDAMAGPTPVSSLIHAATMVAAGVYMLLQAAPLFTPLVLQALAFVGAFTALAAAISALSQHDIKRVLAYSTISQLGMMVMGVGMGTDGTQGLAFVHLLVHAFFKCGLFLVAGAVIHRLHKAAHDAGVDFDAQDIRWMGGLRRYMPHTFVCFMVLAAALAGLPFTSGFLSKEGLIAEAWGIADVRGGIWWLIPAAAIATSALTAFYIARLGMLVFGGKNRMAHLIPKLADHLGPSPWAMRIPLFVLAACSLWVIWSPSDPFRAIVHAFDSHSPSPPWLPIALTALSLAAIALAIWMYRRGPAIGRERQWLYQISFQHFFLDRLWGGLIVSPALAFSKAMAWIDHAVVDGIVRTVADAVVRKEGKPSLSAAADLNDRKVIDGVVNGVATTAMHLGGRLRRLQTGKLQRYLLYTLLALLLLLLGLYYFASAA